MLENWGLKALLVTWGQLGKRLNCKGVGVSSGQKARLKETK